MVINALSVCVSVLLTSLLLTRPLTPIPQWLHWGMKNKYRNKTSPNLSSDLNEAESIIVLEKMKNNENDANQAKMQSLINKVSDVLYEIQKLTRIMEEKNKDDDLETQWKEVASVLNKILCSLFILASFFMSIIALICWVEI